MNNENVNSVDMSSGLYMSVGMNPNPLNRYNCEAMICQFGAKCKYNVEAVPYCECEVRFQLISELRNQKSVDIFSDIEFD